MTSFEALEDDFNTPAVLALLRLGLERRARAARGLDLFCIGSPFEVPVELEQLRVRRENARSAKDWANADAARDELEAAGWAVTDHPGGTAIWPRP